MSAVSDSVLFTTQYLSVILSYGENEAEPKVVVAVVRRVVVAIRRATVPRIVVPAATTIHTVRSTPRSPPVKQLLKKTFSLACATNEHNGMICSA